jgi:hypothetical protein
MAHQFRDRQSSARPVCKRFEPGRLAQACLVEAYARLVPHRRVRLPRLSAGSPVALESSTHASSLERRQEEGQQCS